MPEITIPAAYSRENGNFPEFRMENMFWEETPTNERGVAILSRPPLLHLFSVGSGPIHDVYRRDGLFGGDTFVVSGTTLYRINNSGVGSTIGAVTGSGPVRWANSATEIVVTRGASAHSYNGTNFLAVTFPDAMNIRAVTYLNGYFVYVPVVSGTIRPGRYYFSAVNDGRTVNALDYLNAESLPDELVDAVAFGDNLYLAGSENIEVAMATGNANAPFARIQQRNYDVGLKQTGLMLKADNGMHVVGEDNIVYRLGQVPERISTHGIEEKIRDSTEFQFYAFKWDGHLFLTLRLSNGTWLRDAATGQWTKFTTLGQPTWDARNSYEVDGTPRFGDAVSGKIYEFADFDEFDSGGVGFERVFPAAFPLQRPTSVYNVLVDHNAGATPLTTGDDADPILEMRTSRDGGRTWSNWRSTALGGSGQYRRVARYSGCGMFDSPGAIFEFRTTDRGPLRISRVRVNDTQAGRSRS